MPSLETELEEHFIEKLCGLKYEHRPDIRDRSSLEQNFREKFEVLNRENNGAFADPRSPYPIKESGWRKKPSGSPRS